MRGHGVYRSFLEACRARDKRCLLCYAPVRRESYLEKGWLMYIEQQILGRRAKLSMHFMSFDDFK